LLLRCHARPLQNTPPDDRIETTLVTATRFSPIHRHDCSEYALETVHLIASQADLTASLVTDSAQPLPPEARLSHVSQWLSRAAEKPDLEAVHQLRVSTRRAVVAIDLYSPLLRKELLTWFESQLARIRRSAGQTRDLDVLTERLADNEPVIPVLKQRRRVSTKKIKKVFRKLIATGRFESRVGELSNQIRHICQLDADTLHRVLLTRLFVIGEDFAHVARRVTAEPASIHQLRIEGKRFRYGLELTQELLPEAFFADLKARLTEMQDRLGGLNDHAAACKRLLAWEETIGNKRKRKQVKSLRKRERQAEQNAVREFGRWWSGERAAAFESDMRDQLTELIRLPKLRSE
jgi:CHAD domain-containing protein